MPLPHRHQPEHRLEEGGLPGPVGPDDPDQLAGVGDDVDAAQDVHAGQVSGVQIRRLQHRLGHGRCLLPESAVHRGLIGGVGSLRLRLQLRDDAGIQQRVVSEVGVVMRPEVRVDHRLLTHDVRRRPLRDDRALGHHHHPVRDVAHHVHVVLDEQHRHALVPQRLDVAEERLGQRRIHARHRLVQHDHGRIAHQRPGHLQQLLLAARERPGEVIALVVQREPRQQLVRLRGDLPLAAPPQRGDQRDRHVLPGLVAGPQQHVVEHRHPRQRLGQLERAHHALARHLRGGGVAEGAPVERPAGRVLGCRAPDQPLRAGGLVEPGDDVEEGGLARAVRSDQRGDHAALHLEVLHVHGGHSAEPADDVVHHQDRVGLGRPGHVRHLGERGPRGGRGDLRH